MEAFDLMLHDTLIKKIISKLCKGYFKIIKDG